MFGDGGSARAIEPEFLTCVRVDRDEAFAMPRVGESDDLTGGFHDGILVVRYDVANQHHLWPLIATRFGRVSNRLQITLIKVFEAGEYRVRMRVDEILDLNNRRHGLLDLPEKLQTHGADVLGHAVQNKATGGDDAVAAFFLDAGKARQEFVGDVLAEPGFAK